MAVRILAAAVAAFVLQSGAGAAWHEATSKHFRIYGEGDEKALVDFTTKLEKYDFALRSLSGVPTSDVALKKVQIYLLRDPARVQATAGYANGVLGYYTAQELRPILVVSRGMGPQAPKIDGLGRSGDQLGAVATGENVLLHEYAHHFMYQNFAMAYPMWYSEGFAEYYSTTDVGANDVITFGSPPQEREEQLLHETLPPIRYLLAPDLDHMTGQDRRNAYSQGWLLVHYLNFNKVRRPQLATYLKEFNAGTPPEKAMDDAFGSGAKELDKELQSYASQSRLSVLRVPFKPIDPGKIELRTLSPAEEALIPYRIRVDRGLQDEEARGFADGLRTVVARFPNDPEALELTARAETAAKRYPAAIAAADKLAAQPAGTTLGPLLHADAEAARLIAAKDKSDASWDKVRETLLVANKTDAHNPEVLAAFYDSYAEQDRLPPASAQNALYNAFKIVPQSYDLRVKLAEDFEARGFYPESLAMLKSAANDPHQTNKDVRAMLKRVEEEDKANKPATNVIVKLPEKKKGS